MLLLPVSHEKSVLRRVPWVSIAILVLCAVLQVRAGMVEQTLEARDAALKLEMARVQERAIQRYFARTAAMPHRELDAELSAAIERERSTAEGERAYGARHRSASARFRAGELSESGDPDFARFQSLRAERKALTQQRPEQRLGYRPALDGLRHMLTSMFAHAGWLHLLGNMWFLYLVGCNLEDRWGRWQFATFYVVAGVIAALSFTVLHREMQEPLVGASGAVAGAMGAFMVCFARTEVTIFYVFMLTLIPRWGTFRASAWMVMALWVAQEVAMTMVEASASGSQVAHSAHVGGFLFGALVAFLLRKLGVDSQLDAASERAADDSAGAWREHPLYLDAMQLRDRADEPRAIETLLQLCGEAPDHVAGREALFTLGLRSRDLRAIDGALPFLTAHYQETREHGQQVSLYRELRRVLPDYGLTEQELLRVATAASHLNDAPLVIQVVGELMSHHPHSPLLARGMWLAAQAQARLGVLALQQDTLQRIVRRFPEHACATLARDQLGALEAGGSS